MDLRQVLSDYVYVDSVNGEEIEILKLDDISSVPLSTFTSFFSTANNYEEMKAVDEMNGYGYSRFIEKWHNEGLI